MIMDMVNVNYMMQEEDHKNENKEASIVNNKSKGQEQETNKM